MKHRSAFTATFAGLLIILAMTVSLDRFPAMWWDEGWTTLVARTWVEREHYGRLMMGENAPSGLEAAFPVTEAVALAFRFFGTGLFQARLVIVVYLAAALGLLIYLAYRFYGPRIAWVTLLVLLLMPGTRWGHFIFVGRQVLGEVPALFFLLAGYVCFLWAGERSRAFLLAAVVLWSVAIFTKAQVFPFWALSLGLSLVIAILLRRWSIAALLVSALLGSVLFSYLWFSLLSRYGMPPNSPLVGLQTAVGLVHEPFRRFITLWNTLHVGLICVLGLGWGVGDGKIRTKIRRNFETHKGVVKLSYFILTASWFAWWEFASIGWLRYLFPPTFLASIFAAAMLHEWTQGFRLKEVLRSAVKNLAMFHICVRDLRVLAVLLLVFWSSVHTAADMSDALIHETNKPLFETIEYLHANTPTNTVIETFDAELLFFLNRPYHYPPDQLHVDLIRREDLKEPRVIEYNPLSANPDYLVVSTFGDICKCYDAAVRDHDFILVKVFGPYKIFKRARDIPQHQRQL